MAIDLFGFEFDFRKKNKQQDPRQEVNVSPITPVKTDGAVEIETWDGPGGGAFSSRAFNIDTFNFKSDYERVLRYRKMAANPTVDEAISIIVNDAITVTDTDAPVSLRLDNLDISPKIKDTIQEEFGHILALLNFNKDCFEIFRDWYVDGVIYYHPILKQKEGIVELRRIDPLQIKKVREIIKDKNDKGIEFIKAIREYYVYRQTKPVQANLGTAQAFQTSYAGQSAIAVPPELIVCSHSGVPSEDKTMMIGHLHKAIKPLNNLTSVENALIIYRLSRAPERRVFYIDVGNLPKAKADQAVKQMMEDYRKKMVYDASTGEVDNSTRHMTMIEDFWLARRGDKGTQVETLPGGQNLGEISDLIYFQKNLYKALNIPSGRLEENSVIAVGRVAEMTRDELKFTQFINRIRKRFASIFIDLLRLQVTSKNIMTPEEFDEVKEKIQIDFLQNFYITEQKEFDLLRERIQLAMEMEPTIGKYFSRLWVKKNVLKQSDDEISTIEKESKTERAEAFDSGLNYGDAMPPQPQIGPDGEPIEPVGGAVPSGGTEEEPGAVEEESDIPASEGGPVLRSINKMLNDGKSELEIRRQLELDSINMSNGEAIGFTINGLTYKKKDGDKNES